MPEHTHPTYTLQIPRIGRSCGTVKIRGQHGTLMGGHVTDGVEWSFDQAELCEEGDMCPMQLVDRSACSCPECPGNQE